jgi:hypothetical protein
VIAENDKPAPAAGKKDTPPAANAEKKDEKPAEKK